MVAQMKLLAGDASSLGDAQEKIRHLEKTLASALQNNAKGAGEAEAAGAALEGERKRREEERRD